MLTKRIALSRVKKFLAECESLPFKIDKAILFGSAATGKAGINSDIDLALFSSHFTDNILDNLDLIGKINIRYPEIDAHTYSLKYLSKKGLVLDEIKKTGIEIPVH